jgi:alkylation response protein AidB-like acyl-CoA dehydrogenase
MELELTADQSLFHETTAKFLDRDLPLTAVRALHDAGGGFDRALWSQGCELGWTAMLVPEGDGGGSVSGDGLLDLVLVAEEMGRMVSPGPLLTVNVVADAVARRGTDDQRGAVFPGLLDGTSTAAWAFAEEGPGWDGAAVRLAATPRGDDWVLAGTKTLVQEGDSADTFLVTARTGESLTQLLVPSDAAGVSVAAQESLDLVRRYATVTFSDVVVPSSAVLGDVGDAAPDVERQLEVALVLQNAETVGAVNRVFDFTLEYAQDRMAFGRPIGSYQALKHRFADMKTWLEACNATATASSRAVQADADDAAELVSVAKSYIGDKAPAMIQDCVQLHGGIGVTWEHDLHLYLRRVAQNAALYGTARDHRERLAVLLGV